MWNLERALGEIAGLPHVSLQPSAGRTASSRACC
jgi:glycine cleavage system protein P-like pyridoxal-binding family